MALLLLFAYVLTLGANFSVAHLKPHVVKRHFLFFGAKSPPQLHQVLRGDVPHVVLPFRILDSSAQKKFLVQIVLRYGGII